MWDSRIDREDENGIHQNILVSILKEIVNRQILSTTPFTSCRTEGTGTAGNKAAEASDQSICCGHCGNEAWVPQAPQPWGSRRCQSHSSQIGTPPLEVFVDR